MKQVKGCSFLVRRRRLFKLKACGIVTEYNPFHNGHAYQLAKARELSGADVMIVVMSGNFLQRGEPALVDKWTRAKMALKNGADIVIELPVAFSVQPADYFAQGAVALLKEMKCKAISFGAESGSGQDFMEAGNMFWDKKDEIDQAFKKMAYGESYPRKMQKVIESVFGKTKLDLSKPNNTLGFAYAKINVLHDDPMEIYTVPRKSAQHREENLGKEHFSSATAIRNTLLQENEEKGSFEKINSFVPDSTLSELSGKQWNSWEKLWPYLHYQLSVQSAESLGNIYEMTEGIENRLKEKNNQSFSMNDFLEKVKTKRHTWTKIQRLCVYTLLQLSREKVSNQLEEGPECIRMLGFTEKGRAYLHHYKKEIQLPILSTINRSNKQLWEMDIKAGDVYRLMDPENIPFQDFFTSPIQMND